MSCCLVVKAWITTLGSPPQEGRGLYQGLRCLTVSCGKWCIWRCPMANGKFCSLCHLCEHQLKVLLNLATIGKPSAYFLATCCSKALWSLIWAKAYLFAAMTGALEAWKSPAWFSGMWGSPTWPTRAGRELGAHHSVNDDWVELQNLSFQESLKF